MRLGLTASTVLHGGLLAWGLLTIGAPDPLEVADVEALPVEIVTAEEFAQIVKGADDAPKLDAPAPQPTLRETAEPDAVEIGEAEVDVAVAPAPVVEKAPVESPQPAAAPEPEPNPFEIAEAPMPSDRPEPPRQETIEIAEASEPPAPIQPEVAPEPIEVAAAEPEPAPEPEPTPAPEPEPTPVADSIAAAIEAAATEADDAPKAEPEPEKPAEPQFASLPQSAPKALFRPAKPNRAKTTERRKETVSAASTPKDEGDRNVTDEIAALLNREKPSGGGAAASVTPASLGGSRTNAATLSNSEMDMLRRAIGRCWNPPAGVMNASELVVKVSMQLDRSGQLVGRPQILETSGGRTGQIAGEAAVRAMRRCAPYAQLPAEKFETWSEVVVNFDPRDMF